MTPETIKQILKNHGVPYTTRDGHILADSMESGTRLFEKTEDVTYWTRSQLMTWLGYE